jgi:hypothetical protein
MNRAGPFLFLVAILFIAGLSIAAFRHSEYGVPLWPGTVQPVWQVEARIEYSANGGSTKASLTLPPEQNGFRVTGESGASSGFGFTVERSEQRRATWSKRSATGEQQLYYKLELVADNNTRFPGDPPESLRPRKFNEPYATAVEQVLASIIPLTADAQSLALQVVAAMNTQPLSQNMSLLLDKYPRAELLADLITNAGVNARTVQVLELEDRRRRQSLRNYVQVWAENDWILFDTENGLIGKDNSLLLWQTQTPAVLEVEGGRNSRVTFSMLTQIRSSLGLAQENEDNFRFSLHNLPIAEQGMFKLIMMLPIGALVVVFMRLIVGMSTSGTFMPILIALAFLQTELLPGVASLLAVVAIGLLIRSLLSALNLLLVARIATLVVVVIGIISFVSVLSYELGWIGGLTITFFPMIILAWTIERMSILWEEEGPKEVLIQGGGSLIVAILAYLLMDLDTVRYWAFNFPEVHLCVLAVIMMLGRYTGYRLLELKRFSTFNELEPTQANNDNQA